MIQKNLSLCSFLRLCKTSFILLSTGIQQHKLYICEQILINPLKSLQALKKNNPLKLKQWLPKIFLKLKELTVLNNLVSAYFDLTKINAMEEKPMKMTDYIQELDNILVDAEKFIFQKRFKQEFIESSFMTNKMLT